MRRGLDFSLKFPTWGPNVSQTVGEENQASDAYRLVISTSHLYLVGWPFGEITASLGTRKFETATTDLPLRTVTIIHVRRVFYMRRLIAIALVAVSCASLTAQSASAGFGLFHRGGCCDAAPSCGCEAPAPVCCEPAPTCCDAAPSCGCRGGLLKGIFGKLHSKLHGGGCCAAPTCCEAPSCGCEAPSCGCEAPAPTCCAAPAPTCCSAPAPSCGCEAPSCGCETSCCEAPTCCTPKKRCLMDLLSKFKRKKSCCAAPTCCEAAPSCGCEVAAAPSCGCGS
jgi:hypothetical protein